MKKGLLLSVVASGILFAGGNIAPVAPVAPAAPAAAPAACDFWGSLGFRYDANKAGAFSFGDAANNAGVFTVDLGVEKELGYGFGFGAEVAGAFAFDGKFNKLGEGAEISQLYVTYKTGNTAIKAGRQALPKAVSPWAWTDTTVGVKDNTFNALTVVNTDIANTTLVGAWVPQVANGSTNTKINGSNKGLFMLAGIYSGIANTTLSSSLYYMPKNGVNGKAISVWAAATTKVNNFDLGLQVAYAKADANSMAQKVASLTNTKATVGIAAYAATEYNGFDAKLTLAYINAGNATLNLGGTSGFWGSVGYSNFGGDVNGGKQKIAKLDLGYKLPYGKVFAGVAYDKTSGAGLTGPSKDLAGRLGYSFKVYGVNAKVEYRYTKNTLVNGTVNKAQKIRVEGIYKF